MSNSGNFQGIGDGPVKLIMSFYSALGQDSSVLNTALVCKAWLAKPELEQARNAYRFAIDNQIDANADRLPRESEFPPELVAAFRASHLRIGQLPCLQVLRQVDYLWCDPADMTHDVMRIRDSIGRPGVALRIGVTTNDGVDIRAFLIFQRYINPRANRSTQRRYSSYREWVGYHMDANFQHRVREVNDPLGISTDGVWQHPQTVTNLLTNQYTGIRIADPQTNNVLVRRLAHREHGTSLRRQESTRALKAFAVAAIVGLLASLIPVVTPR